MWITWLCFLRPGVIALTWTDDKSDPQYERSAEAYDYLMSQSQTRKGRRLEVHKIHQPNPILISPEEAEGVDAVDGTLPREAGDRMAASYINFYFCNGGAVVPTFGDPHDAARVGDAPETCCPNGGWSVFPPVKSCSAAAISTASPSNSLEISFFVHRFVFFWSPALLVHKSALQFVRQLCQH